MSRGARAWQDGGDLFSPGEAAPAPPPKLEPAIERQPYSVAESRRLERAFDLFKDWLFAAELGALQGVDLGALARRFPPIREVDLAEMIERQIAAYDRKAETLRKWQRIR